MAFGHGSKARVYVNGWDLTANFKSVSPAGSADVAEVSAFGASAKAYIAGLQDATLSLEGIFDGAVGMSDEQLQAALGAASSIWTVLTQGDVHGSPGFGFDAIETSYVPSEPIDDAGSFTADAQSKVGMERVLVHHVLQAEGALGSSTNIDNLALTSNGGSGYLQVNGTGPITAVTAKIQHSVDNAAWVDLITFTAYTGRTSQRLTVAGTVNRHTRGRWEQASSLPFHLAFCRK